MKSFRKPLPKLPGAPRQVQFVSPPSSVSSQEESNRRSPPSSERTSERPNFERKPYETKLFLRPLESDGEGDSSQEERRHPAPAHGGSERRIKLSPGLSRKEQLLARIDQLERENSHLHKQIQAQKSDGQAALELEARFSALQSHSKQCDHKIRQQDQLIAQIANTVSQTFKEYQSAVEQGGYQGISHDVSDTERSPHPASAFDFDSDSESDTISDF